MGEGARHRVTAEVTPHHLLLTCDLLEGYDPVYKVNPPLRPAEDVQALRAALADGTIDAVATDHAPHAAHDKDHAFGEAAFGMLGLETALGVVARDDGRDRAARLGRCRRPDERAARAHRPGRRPRRGRSRPGSPANLTLVDPAGEWTVDPAAARVAVAQHAVRRAHPAGPRGRDVPPRHADRARRRPRAGRRSGMSAILVLEDGRTFRGEAYGAARRDVRRGRVQHRHDRLPGDADRSVATTARSSCRRRRTSATPA